MRAKAYLPEVEDSPGAIKGNKSVRNENNMERMCYIKRKKGHYLKGKNNITRSGGFFWC